MIRVLIAEDTPAVMGGLSSVLALQPDVEVVGIAWDGVEAVEKAGALSPDVVIMDAQMPSMDGVEATRRIKETQPGVGILFFSVFTDYLEAGIGAGADDCLLKDCPPEELVGKVREIASAKQAARERGEEGG